MPDRRPTSAPRPTSADVARLAGVSRTAVSFVLNGRGTGNISAENADRIRAAAAQLGYVANSAAVNLRRRSTATLGVITDEITQSPFAGRLLQGAREAAYARGYVTIVADYGRDPAREREMVAALRARQVDGFVHAAMSMREYEPAAGMLEVPALLANCVSRKGPAGVIADEEQGGALAVEAVLSRGHTRVAMLAGVEGARRESATERRIAGVQRAAAAAGARVRVVDAGWQIADGVRWGTALLDAPAGERPTALLAARDRVALGVLLAAAHLGLRVPEDVCVVGYDDEDQIAAEAVPALTTVALPHQQIGERTVDLLLAHLLDGDPLPDSDVRVPCRLVLRESVGPAPNR
ncbi:LacI family DNA-binding transcriptional regulator [Ruania alkalisoli]|uniref:LacI family DNA-binding transcriptional regulator n=1 Tax=Ruania alkalisoli TaxID=2779775 RepID=UPI001B355568|nr:LacI family DNA-binding transcriptional regulator [Ruania alkalisoli]